MSRSRPETLVGLLQRWAHERPDHLACVFLDDGDTIVDRLTFGELDARARQIASGLLAHGDAGDRALLVYDTGLDFVRAFCGCIYAGMIAIPVPAPEPSRLRRALPRLGAVAGDAGAGLLLGNAQTLEVLAPHESSVPDIARERWIDTSSLRATAAELPLPDPDAIVYIQYTSGSTADPKGVMVSHENLTINLEAIREVSGYEPSSVTVTWMPHFHDYGLIEGHLMPLFNGTPVYLMSPYAFVKRPIRWLDALSRYGGTHSQAPNFAFGLAVRRVTPEQADQLDLSHVRSIGNAAEPINPRTQHAFCEKFATHGFRREAMSPCYGLAEATLIVSATPPSETPLVSTCSGAALARGEIVTAVEGDDDARPVAGCGRPLPGVSVAIVEPETNERVGPDRVGEIWVSATSVAKGYWQRPEESRITFDARIAGEDGPPFMRTGDLGFVREGQVHVTSRLKDLIIIHGLNQHPQEIEWAVQSAHPRLRPGNGAAFSIFDDGEERLVVVQELEPDYAESDLDEIVSAIVETVAGGFDVAVHGIALIEKATLAKTTSGKVKRSATRDAYLDGSLKTIHLWRASMEGPVDPRSGRRERTHALLAWIRDYAERRINSRLIDERRSVPPVVIIDFGNRGLFGLLAPRRYGGLDLGYHGTFRVLEQLGAVDLTLATFVHLHNTNGTLPILTYAHPDVREELMPLLATGRELAAFALSEPGAGTNLAGVETTAVEEQGAWVLDGVKRWNATAWSNVVSVFARTDRDQKRGALTGFVVRHDDAGVRIGPESLTMGMRGIIQNSFHLESVRVAPGRILGTPGQGMQIAEDILTRGRLAAVAVALGGSQRCAQLMLRYASRRGIDTGRLLENAQTIVKISELIHRIDVDRELLRYCAKKMDGGWEPVSEVGMALKVSATDSLNYAADLLVQVLGGRGYMETNIAPQIFRDARMWSIGEGANEALVAAIGRSMRLKPDPLAFLEEYGADGPLRARLSQLVENDAAAPRGSTEQAARAWRDASLGRVFCAGINLAAAQAMEPRAGEATVTWSRLRFEAQCDSHIEGTAATASAIGVDALRDRIERYRASIGDLEPLAPDVDLDLDPLLTRDATDRADVNGPAEIARRRIEEKKARLRRLLTETRLPVEGEHGE